MKMLRSGLLILFLLFAAAGRAQEAVSDFRSWNTFSITKDVNKQFSLGGDVEMRFSENISRFDLVYLNFNGTYKPAKWLRIGATYRPIFKNKEDNSLGIRHRFYGDLMFRSKPGRFTLSNRARLQWEYRTSGYSSRYRGIPEIFLRNKIDIKYKATDVLTPYIGTELRWQIRDPRAPYNDGFTFERTRLYAGMDYAISDRQTIGAYFLRQFEFNVEDPMSLNVIGIEYSISLD